MSSTPTAEEPTRYTPVHPDAMVCESDGTYVRYDDYAKLRALVQRIMDRASDVIARWDSPKWKWDQHTGDLIHELRKEVDAAASQGFTPTNTTEG